MIPDIFSKLNNYAIDNGFENETQRLQMILDAMEKDEAAVEMWLDEDGTKDGLKRILELRRPVRRINPLDV